jgi:hypothetical protein
MPSSRNSLSPFALSLGSAVREADNNNGEEAERRGVIAMLIAGFALFAVFVYSSFCVRKPSRNPEEDGNPDADAEGGDQRNDEPQAKLTIEDDLNSTSKETAGAYFKSHPFHFEAEIKYTSPRRRWFSFFEHFVGT